MNKHIVIIGGGFAGVNLAEQMRNKKGVHITLVDKTTITFSRPSCTR